MAKVSIKDKVDAVLMYENGETLKFVANKFKTSIPLVHYWKKNKDKLLKELEWSHPSLSSNQINTDNLQVTIKEDPSSHVSIASQNENNHNVFLESQQIEVNNNFDEIESNVINPFIPQKCVGRKRGKVPNQVSGVQTNTKRPKKVENDFISQFKNVQNKLAPIINFQTQFNNFQQHLNNHKNEFSNSQKSCKINQSRRFLSRLSKVQQLQLKEYFSLKNVYDTQMATGEQLKERDNKMGNNSNDDSNLADEIEEYNKVINGDLFIKIIEKLEYLETALFYLID